MTQQRLNLVLLVALVIVVAAIWGIRRDGTTPNVLFIPQMHYSVPFDSQSENPNFDNRMTLRTPVEGTIVRGMMPLHYNATPEDAQRAGQELTNPFSGKEEEFLERGSALFARFCQPCHGATGAGDGIVTRYGFPPPPGFQTPKTRALKDGQIFHIMTFGQGNMPSLASQISRDDRWKLVLKVRSLRTGPIAPTTAGSPSPTTGVGR